MATTKQTKASGSQKTVPVPPVTPSEPEMPMQPEVAATPSAPVAPQPQPQYSPQPQYNQQPQYGPQPQPQYDQSQYSPQPQYGPQPQYNQQPQYGPQPQYLVMQRSLNGVGGWLVFFLVIFGLASLSYIMQFFTAMTNLSAAQNIVALIFSPIMIAAYITTIVFIAMQKRLGKMMALITLAVSAIYSVIGAIVAYATTRSNISPYEYGYRSLSDVDSSSSLPVLIGVIFISITVHCLIALYFFMSKRVKETLVR